MFNLSYDFGKLDGNYGITALQQARGNHGDEGWDSKIREYTVTECALSNAFNIIVKANRSSKRAIEGKIINPPESCGNIYHSYGNVALIEGLSSDKMSPSHSSTSINFLR
jgi:hypothetical protein